MPIYDFECTSCGHKAEVMRKMSEPNMATCPACGKESFAKQLSAPGFQLTGSGWYATDFKGGKKENGQKPETKPSETSATETSSAAPAACGTGCACH
jgi:putative FmdB family regulatory protein